MVTVLVDEISNRINYTFDFIFGVRGVEYTITDDLNEFEEFEGVKLNYSNHSVDIETSIQASCLLSGTGTWKGKLEKVNAASIEYLSFDGVSDPVASIFYVLTRMEEYASDYFDEHHRFPYAESVLKEFNWMENAVCDRWSEYLIKNILKFDICWYNTFLPCQF